MSPGTAYIIPTQQKLQQIQKNDSKTLWNTVKEIKNKTNTHTNIDKIYNISNNIITENEKEICDIFNETYINMGENMAKQIDRDLEYKEDITKNNQSMFLFPTNSNEVKNTIMQLKDNKSPGIDGIKSETLKQISIKYLGIYIDQHLRWDVHINKLVQKLRGIVPLFESHIRYGILGWGGVSNNYLVKLDILQKRVLKIIFHKNVTYPSDCLFKLANVMDVRQIFFLSLVIQQFTTSKNILADRNHLYGTRNLHNLQLPRTQKTIGQRCCSYLAPKMFNALPLEIRRI
ncbi:hypothetical protein NQ317_006774 [Molorchus minor]|uniref:Reverse transcriptase domain-containing protein n=1 Tax=Molorchus minor TaxID=1323400 RepID=A0ABQ9JQG1_9CUCU|nr:hypothetical protein NQ317_006774 [Molorchus minor]